MSVTARLGRFFDRRFLAGLAILGCFCALVGALAVLGAAHEVGGSLATAYARVSSYALATFVFVPVFVFCVPGVFRPVESELWVTRGGRSRTLGHVLARLVIRAAAFSAVLTAVGLVAAALSGSWPLSAWVVFGLVTLVLQALFFMVAGLLTLVVRLLTNSGAYAALAAVGYGALDYLLSMTQASTNPLLWTGWFLTLADETDGLAMEFAGGLRLAVGCALLVALSARLVRGMDFLPKGGEVNEL